MQYFGTLKNVISWLFAWHMINYGSASPTTLLSTIQRFIRVTYCPILRKHYNPWSYEQPDNWTLADISGYTTPTGTGTQWTDILEAEFTRGKVEAHGLTRRWYRKPHKYNREFKRKIFEYMFYKFNVTTPMTSSEEEKDYIMQYIARGNVTTEMSSLEKAWERDDRHEWSVIPTSPPTSLHWLQDDYLRWNTEDQVELLHKVELSRIGNITFKPFPTRSKNVRGVHYKQGLIGQVKMEDDSFDINDMPTARAEDLFWTSTTVNYSKYGDLLKLETFPRDYFDNTPDPMTFSKENLTQIEDRDFQSAEEFANHLVEHFNISSEPLYDSEYFLQTVSPGQETFSTAEWYKKYRDEKMKTWTPPVPEY